MIKFLIDMPLSPKVAEWLVQQGYDAVHARQLGLAKAPDREILQRAAKEKRTVITMDLDLPTILAVEGAAGPSVVLLRMSDPRRELAQKRLSELFSTHPEFSQSATVTVLEDFRIRIRKLPIS